MAGPRPRGPLARCDAQPHRKDATLNVIISKRATRFAQHAPSTRASGRGLAVKLRGDPEGQGVLATQPPPGVGQAVWTSGGGCARLIARGREARKSARVKAADRDHRAEMTGSSPSLTEGGARERASSGRVERRWQHR